MNISGTRLNKAISSLGICSRRDADVIIQNGDVRVNGFLIEDFEHKVQNGDVISINSKDYIFKEKKPTQLYLFHKPKGFLTTKSDDRGRKTIYDIIQPELNHLIYVGRLDFNTEGLLLMTNDGDFAQKLSLPSSRILRSYKVRVYGKIDKQKMIKALNAPVKIHGVIYNIAKININSLSESRANNWLDISLYEGKNREIRRVMEYFSLQVSRLIRVSYGPYDLGKIPVGMIKKVDPNLIKI